MSEKIELTVDNPMPGGRGFFQLLLPAELSDESIQIIREHIEFRRKCTNQGFDNLLELLNMSVAALRKAKGEGANDGKG